MEASQTQDTNLQTDQPDEPLPSVQESVSGRPVAGALPTSDTDIYGMPPVDQAQRNAQLEADQQRHNAASGGGTVVEGERQAQIDDHNARTGDNIGYVTDDARLDQSGNPVDAPQGFGQQGLGQRPQAQQGVQPVSATDAPQGPSTQPPADPQPSSDQRRTRRRSPPRTRRAPRGVDAAARGPVDAAPRGVPPAETPAQG
jgi:hypothetical protein